MQINNLTIFQIFTIRGDPCDLGCPKTDDTPKTGQKNINIRFGQLNYKWIKNPDGTACLKGRIKIS